MTSIPASQPNRLSPQIAGRLAALRRMIRAYVWADGAAAAGILIAAAFWCGLAIDWFFEPPAWARALILLAAVGLFAGVMLARTVLRLRTPLSNSNMAMLLERRFLRLDDSLLTAVELSGDLPPESEGFSAAMLADTCRRAEKRLAGLPLDEVINRTPLRRLIAAAGLLLFSVIVFAAVTPQSFGVWARRSLLFSDELWPRKTHLTVEGFADGVRKVARGTDVEIVALADCGKPLVPKTVEVRYRSEGGSRRRAAMNREGDAVGSGDAWQRYSYTFRGVLAPIEFDIRGGDVQLGGLRLVVVESPAVEELTLSCVYPAYMNQSPRRLPVISAVMEIPYGTRITVHGRAGKELAQVSVDESAAGRQKERAVIEVSAADRRCFNYDLGAVSEDREISVNLVDTDGIKSRHPLRLALAVKADEPPELPVSLRGIGAAVTPRARLPVEGRASDDYGIARLWFEFAVDNSAPGKVELAEPQGNPTEIELKADKTALELGDLGLAAGQKMLVALKAADRFDLGDKPNEGSSQRWLLDVVTPARLLTMLQARELMLRQRFEAIIEEVTETRDSLVHIDFNKNEDAAVRELRCDRAVQNCLKNAEEASSAARGFDDIRMQLINNRIDTEEMLARLQAGIVEPLDRIADKMFPRAEGLLRSLRESPADAETGPQRRDAAKAQMDAILSEMKEVLARMMQLEDYSQAVAILRSIIDEQKKLGRRVEERQKAKLHELLEDRP